MGQIKQISTTENVLLQFSRIFVGGLFIFSGLIKANDPIGFSIKLEDYFYVFAETIPFFASNFVLSTKLFLAIFMCVLEVALGVALLLGVYKKPVAWLLLLMIIFFTWLTGFSAITGKVTDCGCFGDAIPLTPTESFIKDLILLVFIGVIFYYKNSLKPALASVPSSSILILLTVFSTWFCIRNVRHLPWKDFRAYKIGNDIRNMTKVPHDALPELAEWTFIYKNKSTGEEEEFVCKSDDMANCKLPSGDEWEFVDRKEKIIRAATMPEIADFVINNENGTMVTDEFLSIEDFHFTVISPSLEKTKVSTFEEINALQRACEAEGIEFIGFVAASNDQIEEFRHEVQAAYPFYNGDEKVLKTILRSNPGVVLWHYGVIQDKWHWRDLPTFEEIKAEHFPDRVPKKIEKGPDFLFKKGDNIPAMVARDGEYESQFILYDTLNNEMNDTLLSNSEVTYLVVMRDIFQIGQQEFDLFRNFVKIMVNNEMEYFVANAWQSDDISQVWQATGAEFPTYYCDGEVLEKVMYSNIGVLKIKNGTVLEVWDADHFPGEPELVE